MTDPRPPLWEVMASAKLQVLADDPCASEERIASAQLTALADELLPDEQEPRTWDATHNDWIRLDERQRLRSILLAEAERAEGGQS